jgi:biotin operon repressor
MINGIEVKIEAWEGFTGHQELGTRLNLGRTRIEKRIDREGAYDGVLRSNGVFWWWDFGKL